MSAVASIAASEPNALVAAGDRMLVTMRVDGQLFGIPVLHVRDVIREQRVAIIPLAPPEIVGSINLRGRIVTVIDLRRRLRLSPREGGGSHMFVTVEHNSEYCCLMVDSVGEVLTIAGNKIEKAPSNLSENWRDVSSGVSRLENELLVVIDINTLLTLS